MKRLKVCLTTVLMTLLAFCLTFALAACGGNTDEKLETVSIANKTALQKDWYVGDADRTIDLIFTPSSKTIENTEVTVTSSNAEIVKADGLKLSALKAGKATVTVTAEGKTDSVELTVKAAAADTLTKVEISNKAALTAAWKVEDGGTRTVEIALTPSSFTLENTQVTVTSSNPAVISVEGRTLTAVAAGTATITASAGELKDQVDITVTADAIPGLESFSISNKNELKAEWKLTTADRAVQFSFTPNTFNTTTAKVTLSVDKSDVIEIKENYTLHALKVGTAKLTATAGALTDTVDIEVTPAPIGTPTLTLQGVENNTFEMPTALLATRSGTALPIGVAKASDGKSLNMAQEGLSSGLTMEVTSENAEDFVIDEDGNVLCSKPGEYTVRYAVTDLREGGHETHVDLTVKVYRNLLVFNDTTWTIGNEKGEAAEQTLKTNTDGYQIALFNMTPATKYYAEYTMTWPEEEDINGGNRIGFVHFIYNEGSKVDGNAVVMLVDRGNKDTYIQDGDFTGSWKFDADNGPYSYRIQEYRGIQDTNAKQVKLGTLRDGDYFYFFVNDQYVDSAAFTRYYDQTTIPGVFTSVMDKATMGNITWLEGADVDAKITALFAKNEEGVKAGGNRKIVTYRPDTWAADASMCINYYYDTSNGLQWMFTANDRSENGGIVSPYVWFDGDFSVEWDYKPGTMKKDLGAEEQARSFIEIRNRAYESEYMQFGLDVKNSKIMLNVPGLKTDAEKWEEHEVDTSSGVHFKLTRILRENSVLYIMEAKSNAAPEQSFSRIIEFKADMPNISDGYKAIAEHWDLPVNMTFKNIHTTGTYSKMKWTTRAQISEDAPVIETTSDTVTMTTDKLNGGGSGGKLSGITAKTGDGYDITALIRFSVVGDDSPLTVDANGNLHCSVAGTYQVKATVTDPLTGVEATEKIITVTVYRSLTGEWTDNTFNINDRVEDAEQTMTNNNATGLQLASINLAPSQLYYAEYTVEWADVSSLGDWNRPGFAHSTNPNFSADDQWVGQLLCQNETLVKMQKGNWSIEKPIVKGLAVRGLNATDTSVKVATARVGEYFYFFVNDMYVGAITYDAYKNVNTVPAYFVQDFGGKGTIKNIDFFDGAKAQQKVDALIAASHQLYAYAPDERWWQDSSEGIQEYKADESGISFKFTKNDAGENGGIVSPNVYFANNVTVEWDYKNDSIGSGDQRRAFIEVRDATQGNEWVQFGVDMDPENTRLLLNCPGTQGWHEFPMDLSEGAHFKFTRILKEDHSLLIMEAYSHKNPSDVKKIEIEWNASLEGLKDDYKGAAGNWADPVNITFKNKFTAGTWSNIKWTTDVTEQA